MTSYETIFNCFLRKIDDPELADQLEKNADWVEEDFKGYLHSAVARQLKVIENGTVTLNDDEGCVEEDLSDLEIEIIALSILCEYLEPLVKRSTNMRQMFGGKEESFFSQASHLSELRGMLEDARIEVRKLARDYGYEHNSYIGQ